MKLDPFCGVKLIAVIPDSERPALIQFNNADIDAVLLFVRKAEFNNIVD